MITVHVPPPEVSTAQGDDLDDLDEVSREALHRALDASEVDVGRGERGRDAHEMLEDVRRRVDVWKATGK